ncbi:putative quinol monooxygenase [Pseudochryseolinea flava]|uniref:Antibiotic biosynthesis monooxygenase n=1 Tax=Pseudochryseolinea flava TaxID=2059302 RepID=A0A364Y4Q0_9BACT|nr:antibiotic biosynthesis monooxygenase family protein [Pseudochryseolinea flava]RAW01021.1 antibiotic biosynthesis monooxygenase [Pseudochryseolinea flava]
MLIRIVRMQFTEAGTDEFLEIFRANMLAIRNFEGCTHLELLKDPEEPHVFTTLSYWNGPQFLEKYRQSELFANVWGSVKPLFAARTQAFSLETFIEVD